MRWTSTEVALCGVATTVLVAIISALAAYLAAKRESRRSLYADAVQVIASWKEMLYRVRRRKTSNDPDLVSQFHDIQDKLTYYCAWIGAESKYMSRSYTGLVDHVKDATESLIQEAWDEPVRPGSGKAQPGETHPDITKPLSDFARDCRSHLSPWPWRKIAVVWRNKMEKN
jgi:hypothetical protein